jgi:hypothetical protein
MIHAWPLFLGDIDVFIHTRRHVYTRYKPVACSTDAYEILMRFSARDVNASSGKYFSAHFRTFRQNDQ